MAKVDTKVQSNQDKDVSEPNIDDILAKINSKSDKSDNTNEAPAKLPASKKTKLKKKTDECPRGKPKSGRPWKTPKTKFSTIKKTINRRSFEKKLELKNELKHIKELSNSIKEERKKQNEYKKQRREENAQKRLENARKSEVVQVIKNPAKLKRLRKKQLRMYEKRDLDQVKVV